jgi:hypothetical protein
MNIFRPTFTKVVLALVLLVLSAWLWRLLVIRTISDTFVWGFPLQFYLAWGPCPSGETCFEVRPLSLVADGLYWYAVAALLLRLAGSRP